MSINTLIDVIQHAYMLVKLSSHLYAQISLPANTFAQSIELVILLHDYLLVIGMDLLIVETALIRYSVVRIITIREQLCAIWIFW